MKQTLRLTLSVLALAVALPGISYAGQQSEAQRVGAEAGEAAGSAKFCKMNPDLIEKFEVRAAARMAKVALDNVDIAVARVSYKNALAVAASHGPADDCKAFSERFDTLFKTLKPLSSEDDQEKSENP